MFPAAFQYLRAATIDEALGALASHGSDARILAGGQSLIPAMRYRLARPAVLVDINPIESLAYLREENGALAIGARTRDVALEFSPLVRDRYPLMSDASMLVADPVVRQMGTLVGSLCHNDPAGDWGVVALASRASVTINGPKGSRVVPIDEFLVDSFTTAVGDGEMAVEVRFPAPAARSSGSYQKMERKVGDFATSSAAVQIALAADGTVDSVGIAIGASGPMALRVADAEALLKGQKPTADLIRAAGDAARKLADPVADLRGSADYKKNMAGVLVRRALIKSLERLNVGGMN
jgi:carbon-monoxide dehydrogenase medium subunit